MRAGARAHAAGQESEGVYIKSEVAHATSYAAQPTLSGEGRNTSKPRARSARPSVMLSRLCGRISTGISCYHHQMHLLYSHRPNLPTGHIAPNMFTIALLIPNAFVHNAAFHSASALHPPLFIKASTHGAQPKTDLMEDALVAAGALGGVSSAALLGVMLSGYSADMAISMLHHGAFHSPTRASSGVRTRSASCTMPPC